MERFESLGQPYAGASGCARNLDVSLMDADPLPIPNQPCGVLHPHDGRQAVLASPACDSLSIEGERMGSLLTFPSVFDKSLARRRYA